MQNSETRAIKSRQICQQMGMQSLCAPRLTKPQLELALHGMTKMRGRHKCARAGASGETGTLNDLRQV